VEKRRRGVLGVTVAEEGGDSGLEKKMGVGGVRAWMEKRGECEGA